MTDRARVHSDGAPAAIGPYSQAIRAGGVLYCSGQIALHPETGELVGTSAAEQAERCLENLVAVLRAGGSSPEQALRCTVYLVDMADFAEVNRVYERVFGGDQPPARACVAVAQLPRGARVEIDCLALCS